MAQHIPHPTTGAPTLFTREEWRQQGELFARLPRQLPVYKQGPEDDSATLRFGPRPAAAPPSIH